MKFELLEKSKKCQQEILRTLELHQGMTIEEILFKNKFKISQSDQKAWLSRL